MNSRAQNRNGSITVLFLLLLVAVITVGAVAVDYAMMESARTDLRIAADLSSRAAMVEYIENGNVASARSKAKLLCEVNKLFGTDIELTDSDIQPGNSVLQSDGSYIFNQNDTPVNSFRVDARFDENSASGSVPLFFSGVHKRSSVDLNQTATATETYLDIVIVLDRSGSMAFDLTDVDWSYPDGQSWVINYFVPPQEGSRWDSLENAIDVFLDEMDEHEKREHIALVTYSSDYSTYSSHFNQTFTADAVQTDVTLTQDYTLIENAVLGLGNAPMIGGTAISSGIDEAITLLNASPRALYAEKIIVLLTDGQWNTGYDPVLAANTAAGSNIVIHTVSFGAASSASVMQNIADATNGAAYIAPGHTELEDAFRSIARSIGLSYTE